ncbi:type IV pilin N-terminal domain-containing protein [Saliphagus infecundisoli]|uniref:Type IV pilin N-terminal domain-containing protein n=1 Tax=Saliphagus infecundisoli TaxID=1849069 RepID=A0ABD5QJS2_9EURY|nr:type IV pilin N-terminal domain-containing protein [Saliphagus infecundisoli]
MRRPWVSLVVGTLLLIALVVCFAALIAVAFGSMPIASSGSDAAFEMEVGADGEIELDHVAGDPVAVDELSMTISVDGEALEHQPEIPFSGTTGFDGPPSGPINARSSASEWSAGESVSLEVAGTNDPEVTAGDRVTVTLTVDGETIAREETTAS